MNRKFVDTAEVPREIWSETCVTKSNFDYLKSDAIAETTQTQARAALSCFQRLIADNKAKTNAVLCFCLSLWKTAQARRGLGPRGTRRRLELNMKWEIRGA